MIASVTRLHVARWRFLFPFAINAWRSAGQAQRSAGFLGGALALEPPLGFWTFTVWADEKSMRAFRNSDPHMQAMPRLLQWCDGASYTHWLQDDTSVPTAAVAFERLRDSGKLSKVNHPNAAHAAGRTTEDAEPRAALPLRPCRA
jgi:hypothetical protein